ncbi:unnamed protein product [Ostreobium quekettii]|uniref:Beta-hexosaminidase n=1 Tax=Ostreobium quekettii TaxID=121088 RepID=A0A8S1ITP7_9CHLO|nr:unnamed protein product [Ostreobium quekettii]|eukprot:evm.model.scf_76.2 EVM.evm.TU.scf_76.2   scf_76:5971-10033(+)
MGVIPQPAVLEPLPGVLRLPRDFSVGCSGDGALHAGRALADAMRSRHRSNCTVEAASSPSMRDPKSGIQEFPVALRMENCVPSISGFENKEEGYELTVTEGEGVVVRALGPSGVFYGVQTLLQLFPVGGGAEDVMEAEFELEGVKIVDAPRFKWRGTMLDVGRHFFSISFIKKFLDLLAMHKINRFHWHLTEDQGWRLEIKSLPKLTEVGAWRASDGGESYGGYYKQEEIPDILAYAAARFIEVIPEIELPGHCGAALASYPHLSCRGDVMETPADWGIHEDVYCAGREDVFEFLESVLGEVTDLFPAEYIHIGGDECPKVRWKKCAKCQERIKAEGLKGENELQTWFIERIARFLKKRGRKIIGWDEILDGGVPHESTVMSWRGYLGGTIAAKLGHNVIMCPTQHCYLDYRQSVSQDEPGAWYAVLPLEMVYAFNPIPSPSMTTRHTPTCIASDSEANGEKRLEPGKDGDGLDASGRGVTMDNATDDDPPGIGPSARAGDVEGEDDDETAARDGEGQHRCEMPPLTPEEEKLVLGAQANLWTEYVEDEQTVEYMLLPRLCAFSEAVWSPQEAKDCGRFLERLQSHTPIFDAMGVKYRPCR